MSGALNWDTEVTKNNFKIINDAEHKNKGKAANDDAPKPAFEFVPATELVANPRKLEWAMRGIYELNSFNTVSGPYGSYKSFYLYDQGFCAASGLDWMGHKVMQMPCFIILGEGLPGAGDRIEALSIHYGVPVPDCLHLSKTSADLTNSDDAQRVADSINTICPGNAMVIIDTLNRNFGGMDENSSKDMTAFIANCDRAFRDSGKTVLCAHHPGHGSDRGRGSSVLPSSCESEYFIKKNGDSMTVKCTKQKNGVEHEPMSFKTKTVVLPGRLDDEGEPISSLVLELTNDVGSKTTDKSKLTPRENLILTSLKNVLARDDSNNPASLESWCDEVMQAIDGKADAKRMAFNRCKEKLLKLDFIVERDGLIWLCEQ